MSDFLDKFLQRRETNPRDLSRFTVKRDRWDTSDYEQVMEEMRTFEDARAKLCHFVKSTGNGMTSDTFFSLFKLAPQPMDPDKIRPDYLINALVRDELQGMSRWSELRAMGTVGNDLNAALGFINLRETLEQIHDRFQTEAKHATDMQAQQEALYDMNAEQRTIEDLLNDLDPESEAGTGEQMQERLDQLTQQIAAVEEELATTTDQLGQGLKAKMPGLTSMLDKGLGEAIKDAEQNQAIDDLLWGTHRGDSVRLPAAERLALAQRIKDNEKLKLLANLIGPIERFMWAEQRQKVDHAYDEVFDVAKGDDLRQVLPDSMIGLHFPSLRRVFYRDFAEQALLQYELRGEDHVGLGSMLVATDSSGSMAGPKEIWAKAIAISLKRLAQEQKRDFHGLHFGSRDELKAWDFPADKDEDMSYFLAYVEEFMNSGTDFETPLNYCLATLQRDFDLYGHIRGDIVFITDGICQVSPAWFATFKAEQERLGFQIFGVITGRPPSNQHLQDFRDLCDQRVVNVRDLTGPDDMADIFGSIHSS